MVEPRVSRAEPLAGRYRLVDVVHRETNRVGHRAEDMATGRPCLVTRITLPGEQSAQDGRRATARVVRVSERMALLRPGRVARVRDVGADAGSLWVVTEWIDGTPLTELLDRQGSFDHARAAGIALGLLDVLEAAHVAGITHGELSPGQVFVDDGGSVVVTGFGLAGATLAPRVAAPAYAAPEQARDERVGPASDLWALGAILYSLLEGRPPYRDRDRPETTLKGVDRLPLRAPVRSGPLTRTVQGLLRKDSRERLSRTVVREALVRVLDEDHGGAPPREDPARVTRRRAAGPLRGRRAPALGTALAVVTVAAAVLVSANGRSDEAGSAAADTTPERPPSSAGAPAAQAPAPPPPPSPTARAPEPGAPTASPSSPSSPAAPAAPSSPSLPAGFRTYTSPEGLSLALPQGWEPVRTRRAPDAAYRVFFGADDDPRSLALTYSERLDRDPVAVWRDDVQPGLARVSGFERIGDIGATTYQGYRAADMEWLSAGDGVRLRTFGRGFLVGGGRGYSLRWTAPADDWDDAANRRALDVLLRTLRVPRS